MLNEEDITNHIENLKPGIYAVLDSAKDRLDWQKVNGSLFQKTSEL